MVSENHSESSSTRLKMKSQKPTRDGINVSVSQLQKPRTIAQLDCHVAKENGTLVSMVPCAQSQLSRFLLQNLRSDVVIWLLVVPLGTSRV